MSWLGECLMSKKWRVRTLVVSGVQSQVVTVKVKRGLVEPHALQRLCQVVEHHAQVQLHCVRAVQSRVSSQHLTTTITHTAPR